MKKKALSILLALALCGIMPLTAFAADTEIKPETTPKTGDTQVTFNVDPTYTITIPAEITLAKTDADGTVQYIGNGTLKANEGLRLLEDEKIEVRLTDCDYQLDTAATAAYKLPYTVKAGTADITADSNLVATFTTEENATEQTSELTFTAGDPKYAGDYSDTVTFTIAVVKK